MTEELQNYTQKFMEASDSFINQQLYQEYSGLVSKFSRIRTPFSINFPLLIHCETITDLWNCQTTKLFS